MAQEFNFLFQMLKDDYDQFQYKNKEADCAVHNIAFYFSLIFIFLNLIFFEFHFDFLFRFSISILVLL